MQERFTKVAIEPAACLVAAKEVVGEQYWLFVGICAVASLLGGIVPFGILLGPMLCGMYLCFFHRMRGGIASFDDLFRGFEYFVQSLIATLIMFAVSLVVVGVFVVLIFLIILGAGASGDDQISAAMMLLLLPLYLVIFILSILIGTFFIFSYPLIVDRGLDGLTAVKTSFQAVLANIWGTLGLVLLNALVLTIAMLLCYLPIFLVLPICCGAIAIAYRKIFPDQTPATREHY